jgi:probable DNA metabolism protein
MTYLIYDGSFEGLLTAIFEVYALQVKDPRIRRQEHVTEQLFSQTLSVSYNEEKANRVKEKIKKLLGVEGFTSLWKATLSELEGIEDTILGVVAYSLETKKNVLGDFGHPEVLALQEVLKKIGRERHRMTAFVRFALGGDGIFYSGIEPDFDVLPLISDHFKKRYADQKWLIFDKRRQYGIYYDLQRVIPVEIQEADNHHYPAVLELEWDPSEIEFQKLWKNYFKSTNISSRKNQKLHLQHVPRRYWKYLVEKGE